MRGGVRVRIKSSEKPGWYVHGVGQESTFGPRNDRRGVAKACIDRLTARNRSRDEEGRVESSQPWFMTRDRAERRRGLSASDGGGGGGEEEEEEEVDEEEDEEEEDGGDGREGEVEVACRAANRRTNVAKARAACDEYNGVNAYINI
jgi:hypothetical protein